MKRKHPILRWAWNLTAVVAAVVLVIVVVAWVSSYGWLPFEFKYKNSGGQGYILCGQRNGMIIYMQYGHGGRRLAGPVIDWNAGGPTPPMLARTQATLLVPRKQTPIRSSIFWQKIEGAPDFLILRIPHWALAIPPTAIIALWLFTYWRSHRIPPGHCKQCRYNLTGTIAAGRSECPECGAAVTQGTTTT